jgi:hypothetical protein
MIIFELQKIIQTQVTRIKTLLLQKIYEMQNFQIKVLEWKIFLFYKMEKIPPLSTKSSSLKIQEYLK